MATILDTNVASELLSDVPHAQVLDWWIHQEIENTFVTAITEMELRFGVAIMPPGRRRSLLSEQINELLEFDFGGRILPFDSVAARAYASIAAHRRSAGRAVGQSDTQIAAIALAHGMTVATRNIRHFDDPGIAVINPWSTGGTAP